MIESSIVESLIREVAAREIVPRFRAVARATARTKSGPSDLVTEADIETERWLTPLLQNLLPGSVVVGEEATEADPAIYQRLAGSAPVWLIDPVDGTLNFASGLPLFAVMVALVSDGETQQSWIYDPLTDRMATAMKGAGAFVDGHRLSVAEAPSLGHVAGVINLKTLTPARAAEVAPRLARLGSHLLLRCAGQEYLAMVEGRIDCGFYSKTMAWDHAAGCLLVTEAGGVARRLDGRRYRPGDLDHSSPLLAATGERTWDLVAQEILD